MTQIWIDNDGCPNRLRDLVIKAATKKEVRVILVANRYMHPQSKFVEVICVSGKFDAADKEIIERVQNNDLVITSDIPLADEVIALGALVISFQGELLTPEIIKEKLAIRNLNQELRSAGLIQGGPGALADKTIQNFANAFDRTLTKLLATSLSPSTEKNP